MPPCKIFKAIVRFTIASLCFSIIRSSKIRIVGDGNEGCIDGTTDCFGEVNSGTKSVASKGPSMTTTMFAQQMRRQEDVFYRLRALKKKRKKKKGTGKKKKGSRKKNTKPPNVLLILADDLGTGEVPFWWKDVVEPTPEMIANVKVAMPNLERLARIGVSFYDAHSTPWCSSSRYMTLSGNYHFRGSYLTSFPGYGRNMFHPREKSIAEVLRDGANYETAMLGKWHIGERLPWVKGSPDRNMLTSPNYNWKYPVQYGPTDIGFDYSYYTRYGVQGYPFSFFENDYLTTKLKNVKYWETGEHRMPAGISIIERGGEGDKTWDSSAYNQILVKKTKWFIERHLKKKPNDPFFAYVALGAVHTPHSPPDRYLDGTKVSGTYPTRYKDVLYEMDKVVGSLVSIIEDNKLADDTIIIFTSDNGGEGYPRTNETDPSGPLRGQKGQIYDGGHRVPFIVRGDGLGVPRGERRNKLIGLNDIFATLCELAGVPIPYGSALDSVSFAKYMRSNRATKGLREIQHTSTFHSVVVEEEFRQNVEALRWGSMKLLCFHGDTARYERCELYDLSADLGEKNDLVGLEYYKTLVSKMLKKMIDIGPCPRNSGKKFKVGDPNSKKMKSVKCQFFRKKTSTKCSKYWEGEAKCPDVCGRYKDFCNIPVAKTYL